MQKFVLISEDRTGFIYSTEDYAKEVANISACLTYSSTLKTEEIFSSVTSVNFYRRYITEYSACSNILGHGNLKSNIR
jgi:hypothetical protein